MRRRLSYVTLLVVAVSLLAYAGAAPAVAGIDAFTLFPVSTSVTNQGDPAVSGDLVVYEDVRAAGPAVYGKDLATGEVFEVDAQEVAEGLFWPEVSGDIVVWFEISGGPPFAVYAKDLVTGKISLLDADGEEPDVDGDLVVWQHDDTDIFGYNLATGETIPICVKAGTQSKPAISGDLVAWTDTRNGGTDIYAFDLSTGTEMVISGLGTLEDSPAVWGDLIAWNDLRNGNWDVYGRRVRPDGSKGLVFPIAVAPDTQAQPSISDELVVWSDLRNGPGVDMWGKDLSTGHTQRFTTQASDQENGAVTRGRVVWQDHRNGNWDIYGAEFALDPTRASGDTRFETAVAISEAHPTFHAKVAIIATGRDFPDALAAAPLAGVYHAPLLLTERTSIPDSVLDELDRRGTQDVILIGSTAAISSGVANTLAAAGYDVSRIGGANRYETAALIAEEVADLMGGRFPKSAFIARGDAFPDALAASPAAYNRKMPVLLTRPGDLPAETAEALTDLDIEEAVVTGSSVAVSSAAKSAVDALLVANGGAASLRWGGADRYETCAEIATESKERRWVGAGFVGLATGLNFPDALAGGAACGEEYGMLLLAKPDELPDSIADVLDDYEDGIGALEAFGGADVLPQAIVNQAKTKIES